MQFWWNAGPSSKEVSWLKQLLTSCGQSSGYCETYGSHGGAPSKTTGAFLVEPGSSVWVHPVHLRSPWSGGTPGRAATSCTCLRRESVHQIRQKLFVLPHIYKPHRCFALSQINTHMHTHKQQQYMKTSGDKC